MYSENQLIKKIKKRQDRKAADELISRYYREIYAFAYKQTCDQELSLDLTQEIFIVVLKGIVNFDERKSQFRTWLYAVASNKITDYFRSKYHRQQLLQESLQELDVMREEDIALDTLVTNETVKEAMQIVVQYDNVWIKIFQQKIFLEKSFREIAEELDLSENTVKTRYYAMIKRLRKEMGNDV